MAVAGGVATESDARLDPLSAVGSSGAEGVFSMAGCGGAPAVSIGSCSCTGAFPLAASVAGIGLSHWEALSLAVVDGAGLDGCGCGGSVGG